MIKNKKVSLSKGIEIIKNELLTIPKKPGIYQMIGENSEFDQFITDHRWAVLTTMRNTGQPVSSVVAYARDGDTLVVSTPGETFKRKSLERDDHATFSNAGPNLRRPDVTNKPNWTQTNVGDPFQFTEHYVAPGLQTHTLINRTQTIQSVTTSTSIFSQ